MLAAEKAASRRFFASLIAASATLAMSSMWTAPSAAERLKNTFPQSGAEAAGASVLTVFLGDNRSKLTSNAAAVPSIGKASHPVAAVSIAIWMRREEGSFRASGPQNVVLIVIPALRIKRNGLFPVRNVFQSRNLAKNGLQILIPERVPAVALEV